jgi:hypothetical protein
MSGTSKDETTAAIERLKRELIECKREHERISRQFRRFRGGATAVAACLLILGVGAPVWFRSIRAGGQHMIPPARVPAPGEMQLPLVEIGRYYVAPHLITHSYTSADGARWLFLVGGQAIRLDQKEGGLIRRLVADLPIQVPIPASTDADAGAAIDPESGLAPRVSAPAAPAAPRSAPPRPR